MNLSRNPFFSLAVFVSSSQQKLDWSCVCHKRKNETSRELTLHLPWSTCHRVSFPFPPTKSLWGSPTQKLKIKFKFTLHKTITFSPDCGYKATCFTYRPAYYTQKLALWWTCEGSELATEPQQPREPAEQQSRVHTEVLFIHLFNHLPINPSTELP